MIDFLSYFKKDFIDRVLFWFLNQSLDLALLIEVARGNTMPVSFLTAAQREGYGCYAVSPTPDELARFFHALCGITPNFVG